MSLTMWGHYCSPRRHLKAMHVAGNSTGSGLGWNAHRDLPVLLNCEHCAWIWTAQFGAGLASTSADSAQAYSQNRGGITEIIQEALPKVRGDVAAFQEWEMWVVQYCLVLTVRYSWHIVLISIVEPKRLFISLPCCASLCGYEGLYLCLQFLVCGGRCAIKCQYELRNFSPLRLMKQKTQLMILAYII